MFASLRIGVSLVAFALTAFAQAHVGVPQDIIIVSGTAGVDAKAEIVGHNVDNGGDIPAGSVLGHRRFEAEVPGLVTTARGKAETYGPATAVNSSTFTRKRGVLNYYMDLGGLGAWSRTTSAVGSATFTFAPKPGFGVEGYFRAKTSGRMHLFGTATGTNSVTVTAPGGVNLHVSDNDPGGSYYDVGGTVQLPQQGTIQQDMAGTVNGAGRARAKIQTHLYFVPTKIWIEMPNPMGGPAIQGPIIFQ
jgi:hypothetical protein